MAETRKMIVMRVNGVIVEIRTAAGVLAESAKKGKLIYALISNDMIQFIDASVKSQKNAGPKELRKKK